MAETFGQLPETIETRMSQYWYELSLIYLAERSRSKRGRSGGRSAPLPEPNPDELTADGKWLLTG